MKTWYISNNGNDLADGSINAPLSTLKVALAKAMAGDTLTLRGGKYSGGVTVTQPNMTIQAYPGEKVYITGDWTNSAIQTSITFDIDASGGKLIGLDIAGANYYAVKLNSNYDSGDSNIRGASNILIKNCVIHDSGDHAIKITPICNNVTIDNVEVYNPGHVSPDRGMCVDSVQANHLIVQNSYFHDGQSNAIYAKGGAVGVIFRNNFINNFRYSGILLGQSSDENWIDTKVNPNYYENIDGLVCNNVICNVGGAGIGSWAALRPVIVNNTIINAGKQGMFSGLLIQSQEHWPSAGPSAGKDVFVPSTDVTIKNNIVVMDPNSSRPVLSIRSAGLTGFLDISNNLYFQAGKQVNIQDDVHNYSGGLSGWQTLGYDKNTVQVDPKLDALNKYIETSTSPTIDTGVSISTVKEDFLHNPRSIGTKYDIGAYEFAGASVTTPVPSPTPMPMPMPTPTSTPVEIGTGLTGKYFDKIDLTVLKRKTIDKVVNFNWPIGKIPEGLTKRNNFSVRWVGQVMAAISGSVKFIVISDDGCRLWVDGKLIIDQWLDRPPTSCAGSIVLEINKKYSIKLEYYQKTGGAEVSLWWKNNGSSKELIPTNKLFSQ